MKGQPLHSDVSAPESFALGALTPAPLPRVFKEGETTQRGTLLESCRRSLLVEKDHGLSPLHPMGEEEARYFGARLLTLNFDDMQEGLQRPFVTNDAANPLRNYDAEAEVGDIVLLPGGTPHHGPPSDKPILRVFFLCRRYGTCSPYQEYSQIMVGETDLFYACLNPTHADLYARFVACMVAYIPMFHQQELKTEDSPIAKAMKPLAAHLDWLASSGPNSDDKLAALRENAMGVLRHAVRLVSKDRRFAKLQWTKWGNENRTWKDMREWAKAWAFAHLEAKAAEALAGAKRHAADTARVVPLKKRKGKK